MPSCCLLCRTNLHVGADFMSALFPHPSALVPLPLQACSAVRRTANHPANWLPRPSRALVLPPVPTPSRGLIHVSPFPHPSALVPLTLRAPQASRPVEDPRCAESRFIGIPTRRDPRGYRCASAVLPSRSPTPGAQRASTLFPSSLPLHPRITPPFALRLLRASSGGYSWKALPSSSCSSSSASSPPSSSASPHSSWRAPLRTGSTG